MKKIVLFSLTAIFSMALVGCDTTSNTNVKVNGNKVAPNTAVVATLHLTSIPTPTKN